MGEVENLCTGAGVLELFGGVWEHLFFCFLFFFLMSLSKGLSHLSSQSQELLLLELLEPISCVSEVTAEVPALISCHLMP